MTTEDSVFVDFDEALLALSGSLRQSNTAILVAPPGEGKTTRAPLHLLTEPWLEGLGIVMLEPRRLAAVNAACFMAKQLDEEPGGQVGYSIRHNVC